MRKCPYIQRFMPFQPSDKQKKIAQSIAGHPVHLVYGTKFFVSLTDIGTQTMCLVPVTNIGNFCHSYIGN